MTGWPSSLLDLPLPLRSPWRRSFRRIQHPHFMMREEVGGAVGDAAAAAHEEQGGNQDDRDEGESDVVAGGEAEKGERGAAGFPAEEDEERAPCPAADPARDDVHRK